MPMPVGAVQEITWGLDYNSERYMNVLHYRTITQPTGTPSITDELNSIINALIAVGGVHPLLLAIMAQNVTNHFIRAQEVDPIRSVLWEVANAGAGLVAQDATTGNISAVLTKRTDFAGRDQVGSFHLAGVPETEYADGQLNNVGGWYGDFLTFGSRLLDNIVTTTNGIYEPVLWHKNAQPRTATRVTQFLIQPQVRIMHRRTVGLGI